MGLVVLCALAGTLAGLLRGGSLAGWAAYRLRGLPVLVGALLVQAAALVLLPAQGPLPTAALAGTLLLAAAGVALDRRAASVPLGLGLLLNAAVVLANGSMPVALDAVRRAGLDPAALALGPDPRHEPLTAATRLPWLADVLAVPLPLRPEVVSPGDVLVAAGAALLCARATMGADGRPARPRATSNRLGGAPHGEEGPAPSRARQEQGQPRQAPERLRRRP
nr:DUF5317 family protein [Vallicoccus soli]